MYEHDEILSLISRLREETDKWEAEIKAGDFKKFYQKNNSSAGKRIRSICLTMMKRCKIVSTDGRHRIYHVVLHMFSEKERCMCMICG